MEEPESSTWAESVSDGRRGKRRGPVDKQQGCSGQHREQGLDHWTSTGGWEPAWESRTPDSSSSTALICPLPLLCCFESGSCRVVQVGLKLSDSSISPTSASQIAKCWDDTDVPPGPAWQWPLHWILSWRPPVYPSVDPSEACLLLRTLWNFYDEMPTILVAAEQFMSGFCPSSYPSPKYVLLCSYWTFLQIDCAHLT